MCDSNPVSAITDPISDVLGTDGDGGGILGAAEDLGQSVGEGLASIDPGPAIGDTLADVDKFVGDEIPGGWGTVGGAAALGTGLYFAPELMALAGGEAAAGAGAAEAASTAAGADVFGGLAGTGGAFESLGAAEQAAAALSASQTAAGVEAAITQALPYTEAYDAWNLAQQGLGATDIASNLTLSAGVDPFIAADMAQMAANGLTPEAIAQNLSYSYSAKELAPLGMESLQATLPTTLKISPMQAIMGAKMASGLLGAGRVPQQVQPQRFNQSRVPQGAVDYTPILSLLNIKQPQRNKNSLLG